MSTLITEECINCGACEPECPNSAIFEGGAPWDVTFLPFSLGQAHVEALGQAGEPELAQGRLEGSHKGSGWRSSAGARR